MHLSTTKNKIQNPWQNQNKIIFMSTFMTHVHYLHSVLPHSEYLKSMLLNTLLSAGCGGVCLKSQRVGDWGRTSQVQEQPGFSSTPCLRKSKPLQKPVLLGSAGWVFPRVFLFWFWGGCFFFSAVSFRVFSNPLGTSICHLGEGGLTRHWGDLAVDVGVTFF